MDKSGGKESPIFSPGLEGVIAGTSSICDLSEKGDLLYRGYTIQDLAKNATYEEVAYLLLLRKLPNRKELKNFTSELAKRRALPDGMSSIIHRLPKRSHPMDVLRTGVSLLGLYDGKHQDSSKEANLERATNLIAQVPVLLTDFYRYAHGLKSVRADETLNNAENLLYMLTGEHPDELRAKVFSVSMILYAEHELNASTFSARVTASTLTDIYSAITSAIGTLRGPLHGGANEAVAKMLVEIGDVSKAEAWVEGALARKQRVMGFGHRIHKTTEDPRSAIIKRYAKELGEHTGNTKWYDICVVIDDEMRKQKNLYPNLDLYTAVVYLLMGIPIELYTPIFVCSRLAGWSAHVIEQQENNRLIRPRSIYTGPKNLQYLQLDARP